ncbi:hypothetical protein N1F89_04085 [Aquibium sp. A9E412]|uniref:hypothetical protein n=1 Tax=Aquibium sp. A9E412 TaxID=2976767 RepID=UPI0025B0881E|nr:hypothetical protein [Aquibium sp. A9E412]MDN2565390.1 hypothetical protein [Aquibium sp. A9E412]
MKKMVISLALVGALAGCTTTEQDAAVGGAAGAVIGGLASDSVGGAVIGGVAGAAAGVLIGKAARTGYCRYRDRYGRIYEAPCR